MIPLIHNREEARWTITGINGFYAKVFNGPLLASGEQVVVVPAELLERAEERLRAVEGAAGEARDAWLEYDHPSCSAPLGAAMVRLMEVLDARRPQSDPEVGGRGTAQRGPVPDPATVDWQAAYRALVEACMTVPIKQHDRTPEQQAAVERYTTRLVQAGELLAGPELGMLGLPLVDACSAREFLRQRSEIERQRSEMLNAPGPTDLIDDLPGSGHLRERAERAEERLRAVTEAGRALVAAVDTWLRETQPGQHINSAKGRGASRRAVTALDAVLSSQEPSTDHTEEER